VKDVSALSGVDVGKPRWKRKVPVVAQQKEGIDCGVCTVAFAREVLEGRPLNKKSKLAFPTTGLLDVRKWMKDAILKYLKDHPKK